MTTFIQLHLLTAYAPSNLNRDDTGRPKTARMGGVERLRVSSQSLKRAWRTSDTFTRALKGEHVGIRTRRIGTEFVYDPMVAAGVSAKIAQSAAAKIAGQFGALKNEKNAPERENLNIEQVVHISNHEKSLIEQLVATLIDEKREPEDAELDLLRKQARSVDMALFGRMLASKPGFNVEAACQVAHALGVSAVTIEDDFFTAVDDLNLKEDDAGSAHMGEQGFASALFYTYICISRDLLLENLGGDEELTASTLAALAQSAMTVSPGGKQNSFASRAYASYALVEKGEQQPRSLAVAFMQPIRGDSQLEQAINQIEEKCRGFDKAYGNCADRRFVLNVEGGSSMLEASTGSLPELLDFVRQ